MDAIFKLLDDNPAVGWGLCIAFVILCIVCHKRRTARSVAGTVRRAAKSALDQALLWWSQYDPFTIRDLLNGGLLILGRAGSGKTSSSGRALMQAIVKCIVSAGLILAAKPEDAEDVVRIFKKAGRLGDLIIFGPDTPYRFNFLRYAGKGDARNVTRTMMMIGETLERGDRTGGEDGDYWKAQCERLLETAVIALQIAGKAKLCGPPPRASVDSHVLRITQRSLALIVRPSSFGEGCFISRPPVWGLAIRYMLHQVREGAGGNRGGLWVVERSGTIPICARLVGGHKVLLVWFGTAPLHGLDHCSPDSRALGSCLGSSWCVLA